MESIITDLFLRDEFVKRKDSLRIVFEQPKAIPSICQIIVTAENTEIRHYAAVLLRKHIAKLRNWEAVPFELQIQIKQCTIISILYDSKKTVRNAMAKTAGVLAKHEFAKDDLWRKQVLHIILDYTQADDEHKSEIGSSAFKILTETAPYELVPYIGPICKMFSAKMKFAVESGNNMATPVILNILYGMSNLVPNVLHEEAAFQESVPYVIKAIQTFAQQDPQLFIGVFDILEYMADITPKLLSPHLNTLLEFSLNVASSPLFQNQVRVRVVPFIGGLVKYNKKAILKNQLLEPIIEAVFKLMSAHDEDGEDTESDEDDYCTGNEHLIPRTAATYTMGLVALHVPSRKFIPPLLQFIVPAVQKTDPHQKKAAYLCLAVVSWACSKAVRAHYLTYMLYCVKTGLVDPSPLVRQAALFALGKFSKYLQPEMRDHSEGLLPTLVEFLNKEPRESLNHIDRMFYSLETYIENLEDAIVPYLPVLMQRLFEILRPENKIYLRKCAISCVASVAKAAKTQMLPYFQQIYKILKVYLVQSDIEDIDRIQIDAIYTLAALVRTIGKENFMPITHEITTFALIRLKNARDPLLRSGLYNLFGALVEANAEIASILKKIVAIILKRVKSTDDIPPEFKDCAPDVVAEVGSSDESEENINPENYYEEYADEKMEAVVALSQFAKFSGREFVPYISVCFEDIYKLLDNHSGGMRTVALKALTQFILSLNQNNDDAGVQNVVTIFVPKVAEIIENEKVCDVVVVALNSYGMLLEEMKEKMIFTEEIKMTIFMCIEKVLTLKVSCQFYDNQGDEGEQAESEYDELLFYTACEVHHKFGSALSPDEFSNFFRQICPILTFKIVNCESSEKCFAYAALTKCFQPLQSCLGEWFEIFLPGYLQGFKDEYDQVRQVCVYGVGELALHSGEVAYPKFSTILAALTKAVAKENNVRTLDYICGAYARLIIASFKIIPLEQVLPILVQKLPLRHYFDENLTIFKCFATLWEEQPQSLWMVLDGVIMVGMHVLIKNQYNGDEPRIVIQNLLQDIRWRFGHRFNRLVSTDPEIERFVQTWSA